MTDQKKPSSVILRAGVRVAETMAKRNLTPYGVWTHGELVFIRQETGEVESSWMPIGARPERYVTPIEITTAQGAKP